MYIDQISRFFILHHSNRKPIILAWQIFLPPSLKYPTGCSFPQFSDHIVFIICIFVYYLHKLDSLIEILRSHKLFDDEPGWILGWHLTVDKIDYYLWIINLIMVISNSRSFQSFCPFLWEVLYTIWLILIQFHWLYNFRILDAWSQRSRNFNNILIQVVSNHIWYFHQISLLKGQLKIN